MKKDLYTFFNVMSFTGINIVPNSGLERQTKLSIVMRKLCGALIILFITCKLIVLLIQIFQGKHFHTAASAFCIYLFSLLIWLSVYTRRRKVAEVLTLMTNVYGAVFPHNKPCFKRWIKLASFLIILHPLVWSIIEASAWDDQSVKANVAQNFFYNMSQVYPQTYIILYVYTLASLICSSITQNTVALIYIFLCIYLRCVLQRYNKLLKQAISEKGNRDFFLRLHICKRQLTHAIRMIEETFSIPVFLLTVMSVAVMFRTSAWIFDFVANKDGFPFAIYMFHSTITSVVSFSALSYFASEVNLCQNDVESTLQDLSHAYISPSILFDSSQSHIVNALFKSDVIPLSGFKVFVFTRGFILSAFGNILTYSLLVLQLSVMKQ